VLIGAPFREDVWGCGGIALRIINTLAVYGGERLASHSGPLNPSRDKLAVPSEQKTGWVLAGLGTLEKGSVHLALLGIERLFLRRHCTVFVTG
jgi:hypothetical protein